MDKYTAEKLAKAYLIERMSKNVDLTLLEGPHFPVAIWGFNPAEEYLFTYSFGFTSMLGGSKYVSVSRTSGKVRDHGVCGD